MSRMCDEKSAHHQRRRAHLRCGRQPGMHRSRSGTLTCHQWRRRGDEQLFRLVPLFGTRSFKNVLCVVSRGRRGTAAPTCNTVITLRCRRCSGATATADHPRMTHGGLRLKSLVRIPSEAFCNEVDEKVVVITFED